MKSTGFTLLLVLVFQVAFTQELAISENQRYLIYKSDSTPFFWLGDTAWELFHKLDREEALHYLQTRADQGFTVIQAVILAERDGVRTPNAYGDLPFEDLDPKRPNEAYFEHVDFIIDEANKLGLVMGVLPTWGDKVYSEHPGAGPILFGEENARIFGEYLGRRYRDANLVWILGGDRDIANEEVRAVWDAMAAGIAEGDGKTHLMTYHPRGSRSSGDYLHDADWMDFNMYQSSHARFYNPVYEFALKDRALQPTKPTLDGEPAYEDIPVAFWEFMKFEPGEFSEITDEDGTLKDRTPFTKGFFDGKSVRVHAYWNILAGAAGYTYGNNAVWQMHKKGETFVIPALTDWKDALRRPGAESMRFVRKLFEMRSFSELVPAQELIVSPNPEGENHIRAAKQRDGDFAVIYLANPQEFELDLSLLNSDRFTAFWYDPRNGSRFKLPEFGIAQKVWTAPSVPDDADWVLVIEAK
ncbi:glycoside hydrolase family 140 protein [Algoriphagus hitonicola]|uniref:Putative collagen-binding domain of a collagenase n=1 Tax=Algoriphagus hitonicola TaxID=435880 RepID=A0A1I2TKG4_9BACT|nr:glycoside hydrolase family 140 protein [Algoriphagus hitonicola]SFG65358.1 Putative collagen-binding domain of a collagenase [Algoriphagus hitonicola]